MALVCEIETIVAGVLLSCIGEVLKTSNRPKCGKERRSFPRRWVVYVCQGESQREHKTMRMKKNESTIGLEDSVSEVHCHDHKETPVSLRSLVYRTSLV